MPRVESHLVSVFETLLEAEPPIPFILSREAQQIPMPETLIEKLDKREREGLALIAPWCPQQTILRHSVSHHFNFGHKEFTNG